MFNNKFDLLRDYFDNEKRTLNSRIADLEMEIEKLKTHINSLRGLINRKSKIELATEIETIKNVDGLDSLRTK